jgi:hypothetical protein
MERRGFLKFLGTGIATAALAVHMKFGELAPVLEPVTETTLTGTTEMAVSYSQMLFHTGDAVRVDGEVVVVTAIHDGVITVERPRRRKLFGVSVR